MNDALEAIAGALPPPLALELLEAASSVQSSPSTLAMALELSHAHRRPSFPRLCERLEHALETAPEPRIVALMDLLFREREFSSLRHLASAELFRSGSPRAALSLYAAAASLGDEAAARAALDRAEELSGGDEALGARVRIERLRDSLGPFAARATASLPTDAELASLSLTPRDRLLVVNARLAAARGEGPYVRAGLLDELVDLAREAPPLGSLCLSVALCHADVLGARLSPIEIDRIAALRDRARPELVLGEPFDPGTPSQPPEMLLRARHAILGGLRGPPPPPEDPHHGPLLAIEAVAHLVAGREAAALETMHVLGDVPTLPRATWALLHGAAARASTRRAVTRLSVRAALELSGASFGPPFALCPIALAYDGLARRALLIAAFRRGEPQSEELLRTELEADARGLSLQGERRAAIELLEAFGLALGAPPHDSGPWAVLLR